MSNGAPAVYSTAFPGDSALRRHGKSFHFAGQFLKGYQLRDCARLYAFCRYVDDLADCSSDKEKAGNLLSAVEQNITNVESRTPVVRACLNLTRRHRIDRKIVIELIRGIQGDLDSVAMDDWPELIRYCYRAAGTVGLMMAQILGARDLQAMYHAIDLGIAMQLTNIARDVEEDAREGRVYLPKTILHNLEVHEIANPDEEAKQKLRSAVSKVLDKADQYYASGEAGLAYLPGRSRLSILIASRVYRAIGTVLRKRDCATWEGRAHVPGFRKATIAAKALAEFWLLGRHRRPEPHHQASLHRSLSGMFIAHRGDLSA